MNPVAVRRIIVVVLAVTTAGTVGACASAPPVSGPAARTTTSTSTSSQSRAPDSAPGSVPAGVGGWLTYDHGPQRSGADPTSPPLSAVRLAWTSPLLDGAVYAQPLVTDGGVIIATEDDSLYSLDPTNGSIRWRRHLATPVSAATLPCGDIDPSGITGTPVVDPSAQLVWVVTFSANPYEHTLWALRLADGTIAASRRADAPGTDAAAEQQRGALTFAGGRVYIPYGGLYGDCGDYHGEVVAISTATGTAATATRPLTYTTPAARAGIWAPPGPVIDSAGDLLVATGNGLPVSPPAEANSVVRLTPELSVVATFTAPDYVSLSQTDRDLGSTSPTLVGTDVIEVGKEGVAYLLDESLHLIASSKVCAGGFGGTAVSGSSVFLPCFDGLYALRVSATGVSVGWKVTGRPGPPVLAGGDVWTVDRGGHLDGFDMRTGRPVYTGKVATAGSFPTLSAYKGTLYVPASDHVEAFGGA